MTGAELIGQEELKEIQELFDREKVMLYRYGPNNYKTKMFEKEFAEYMGVKYALHKMGYYDKKPQSYFLINDGKGNFSE